MTAIARELLGFIWAIGIKAEAACMQQLRHDGNRKDKTKTFQIRKKTKTLE
jgi:hypothetical protein